MQGLIKYTYSTISWNISSKGGAFLVRFPCSSEEVHVNFMTPKGPSLEAAIKRVLLKDV